MIGVCYYPRLSCCAPYTHMIINGTHACGPQPVEPPIPGPAAMCCPKSGFWAPWGAWSGCTGGTCGGCGSSSRSRACQSEKWGCSCNGDSSETMSCRVTATWSEWTVTTACPVAGQACGGCNTQVLKRTCNAENGCVCFGSETDTRVCNYAPCTTNGTTTQNATCCGSYTLQDQNGNNLTTCGVVPTPAPAPSPMTCGVNASCCAIGGVWSEWSTGVGCNDTCGNCGIATYTRFCTSMDYNCPCAGSTTKQGECAPSVCLYPRQSCCGSRYKMIIPGGFACSKADDTDPPPSTDCWTCCPASGGYWSEWSSGTACTDTCGSCGNTTQTRVCLTTQNNCACVGASTRVVNCNIGVCYYPRLSCCDPYTHMIINGTHACGPQPNYTTPYAPYDENCTLPPATCCPPGGTWSEWTQTPSQCSDFCGACGNVTKSRTCLSEASGCPCTGVTSYQTQCSIGVCYYPRLSCCPGYSAMVANGTFVCGVLPAVTDVAVAPTAGCPNCCPENGIWSEWSATAACNDTCGSCGIQRMTRKCLSSSYGCPCTGVTDYDAVCANTVCLYPRASCCAPYKKMIVSSTFICGPIPPAPANIIVNTTCCPPSGLGLWSDWAPWTSCTATCGLCGTQSRNRTCSSAKFGCPCVGNSTQTQKCGAPTCATGAACCAGTYPAVGYDGFNFCQAEPPATCTGTWTEWLNGTGSTCNDTCGNCGFISQFRYCFPSGCQCSGPFVASNPCANTVCLYPRASCCAPYKKMITGGKFICG